ncbi:MAG: GNAT family N-acetyltransferase [Bacteroidales bacterium]|nr:GNAT family N-acetyltransferase [Bacteroidales bacterium]
MQNRYQSWNEYYGTVRSNYRRRLNKILQAGKGFQFEKHACTEFTEEMHEQYLNVYKRSSDKLEKLSFGFFKNLPADFQLTVCRKNGKILGWDIALLHAETYYFFLGGIDYSLNKEEQIYLSLLTRLIEDGINSKAHYIDLGQTAEIAKMRMGGYPKPLYMEAHHSIKLFHKILSLCSPMLEYRRKLENTNAFKEVDS